MKLSVKTNQVGGEPGATSASRITPKDPSQLVEKPSTAIKWWAVAGAFFIAVQLYVYTRWVFSPYFTKTNSGPDPIPLQFRIAAHAFEILAIGLLIWGMYRWVFRPWRDGRGLAPAGFMWFAGWTVYWLDWACNYAAPVGNYNGAFFFNRGSWYNFIPGWSSPNGMKVAELNSFGVPIVVIWFGLGSLGLARLMKMAKARWPGLSKSRVILVGVAAAFLIDLVLELIMVVAGLYTYAGSTPWFTLFRGHYYQFPLWEDFFLAPMWGMCAALLYFTDDRGHTWVDRGIDRLNLSPRKRGGLRFLAFAGFLNILMVLFSAAWVIVTLTPGYEWTRDIVGKRSYLNQGLCGPGTDVACPSKAIPLQQVNGIRVDPDGNIFDDGRIVGKMDPRDFDYN